MDLLLFEQVLRLKAELDSLRPINAEQEAVIMQKFRLDWNYHSNHLEGNSLTYGETRALLLFHITAQGKPLKEQIEMTSHDEAKKLIEDLVRKDYPLTEGFIRELHSLILKEPYEVDVITPDGKPTKKQVHIGEYKRTPNHVLTKTKEIFRFASPEETPAQMHDLLNWYREKSNDKTTNPLILAAEFHYRFIRIHPFDDGNGRTARMLMNFILMQHGYPPVIIKTEDKENYFAVLRLADAGNVQPFIEYIARNLVRSLEMMISGAKGNTIEEPDDVDKSIRLLEHRLNTISQQVKVTRSLKTILDVYYDTFRVLSNFFIEEGKKFKHFYLESMFAIYVDNSGTIERDLIEANRDKVKETTRTLMVQNSYRYFKHAGLGEFNYSTQATIEFGVTTYILKDTNNKVVAEHTYGQALTVEEIMTVVREASKNHLAYIEKQTSGIRKA